jgi:hypothetical protein
MALPLLNILSMLNILSTRLVRGTFFLGTYGGAADSASSGGTVALSVVV